MLSSDNQSMVITLESPKFNLIKMCKTTMDTYKCYLEPNWICPTLWSVSIEEERRWRRQIFGCGASSHKVNIGSRASAPKTTKIPNRVAHDHACWQQQNWAKLIFNKGSTINDVMWERIPLFRLFQSMLAKKPLHPLLSYEVTSFMDDP